MGAFVSSGPYDVRRKGAYRPDPRAVDRPAAPVKIPQLSGPLGSFDDLEVQVPVAAEDLVKAQRAASRLHAQNHAFTINNVDLHLWTTGPIDPRPHKVTARRHGDRYLIAPSNLADLPTVYVDTILSPPISPKGGWSTDHNRGQLSAIRITHVILISKRSRRRPLHLSRLGEASPLGRRTFTPLRHPALASHWGAATRHPRSAPPMHSEDEPAALDRPACASAA